MHDGELVAIHRSLAMLSPGSRCGLRREEVLAIVEELLAARALLARLGADLQAVAHHARAPTPTRAPPRSTPPGAAPSHRGQP